MLEQQKRFVVSPYMEIYDLVVQKDNLLQKINQLIDFVYENLPGRRIMKGSFPTKNTDMEHLALSNDKDAKTGHKTADSSFFGYKTHIAMTEERIITSAAITTDEKNDGKELEVLYNKSRENGIKIETIIGDAAYSEKGNVELAEKERVNLVARLNPSITQGRRRKEDEFQFNKAAGMYVCRAGHMAVRNARQGKRNIG